MYRWYFYFLTIQGTINRYNRHVPQVKLIQTELKTRFFEKPKGGVFSYHLQNTDDSNSDSGFFLIPPYCLNPYWYPRNIIFNQSCFVSSQNTCFLLIQGVALFNTRRKHEWKWVKCKCFLFLNLELMFLHHQKTSFKLKS